MSAAKEYFRLRRNIDKLTDGQASLSDVDWDSGRLDQFRVVVSPNGGYYKGGQFVFLGLDIHASGQRKPPMPHITAYNIVRAGHIWTEKNANITIRLKEDYPTQSPPYVFCETDVLHPNIDPGDRIEEEDDDDEYSDAYLYDDGNVCLNLFNEGVWNPSFGLESVVLGLLFLMHNPNFEDPLNPEFEYLDENKRKSYIEKYMNGEEVNGRVYKVNFVDKNKTSTETIEADLPTSSQSGQKELHVDEDCVNVDEMLTSTVATNETFASTAVTKETFASTAVTNETFASTAVANETFASTAVTNETFASTAVTNETFASKAVANETFASTAVTKETFASTAVTKETFASTAVTNETFASTAVANETFPSTAVTCTNEILSDNGAATKSNPSSQHGADANLDTSTEGLLSCSESSGSVQGRQSYLDVGVDNIITIQFEGLDIKASSEHDCIDESKGTFSEETDTNIDCVIAPSGNCQLVTNTESDIQDDDETNIDSELDEDIVNTRLVALDGGYVLFGGTDCELQKLKLAVSENEIADTQKTERITA